jgi:hypothetical protein
MRKLGFWRRTGEKGEAKMEAGSISPGVSCAVLGLVSGSLFCKLNAQVDPRRHLAGVAVHHDRRADECRCQCLLLFISPFNSVPIELHIGTRAIRPHAPSTRGAYQRVGLDLFIVCSKNDAVSMKEARAPSSRIFSSEHPHLMPILKKPISRDSRYLFLSMVSEG